LPSQKSNRSNLKWKAGHLGSGIWVYDGVFMASIYTKLEMCVFNAVSQAKVQQPLFPELDSEWQIAKMIEMLISFLDTSKISN
jgi:hypothetical protein